MPRWLLVALSLCGCSPGLTALDVPDSVDAFAVVTHDRIEDTWYAQVEGGEPPVFDNVRNLDVFVFKSKFDVPQGILQYVGTARGEFPTPDLSYRLIDQEWQTTTPGPEFVEFRYEPNTPPCPRIRFLGLQTLETELVSAVIFGPRILVFTEGGTALFVESGQSQVVVNTELGIVERAAGVANQVYMLSGDELVRGDLEDDLNDRQPVSSERIVTVYQGKERVFAVTDTSVLLEFDASGLKNQISLPSSELPNLQKMSLVDTASGIWVGLGRAVFRLEGSALVEVASFDAPVTALVTARENLIVFAGDVHKIVGTDVQVLLTDDGPDIFAAVEWTNGFVAALRSGPAGTVSEILTFDTDNARRCELRSTPPTTPFLALFGANPLISARDSFGAFGLLLLTER